MEMAGLLHTIAEPSDENISRVYLVHACHGKKARGLERQVFSTVHHMYGLCGRLHSTCFEGRPPPQE
jgi:hypothetical protein